MKWLADALTSGTATLVSDGSYNRLWCKELASAGWKIQCSTTGRAVSGSFFFRGKNSNAYRAELMGVYALHAFLLSVCTAHKVEDYYAKLCCNNERALELARDTGTRVVTRRKHADVMRAIALVKKRLKGRIRYVHVRGHQDDNKPSSQLSQEARLNCACDTLAKDALRIAFLEGRVTGTVLPHEVIAVHIGTEKEKVTHDAGPPLRKESGKRKARIFYVKQK